MSLIREFIVIPERGHSTKHLSEVRKCALRLVSQALDHDESQWVAVVAIASIVPSVRSQLEDQGDYRVTLDICTPCGARGK